MPESRAPRGLYDLVTDCFEESFHDIDDLLMHLARKGRRLELSGKDIVRAVSKLRGGIAAGRLPGVVNLYFHYPFCNELCEYCSFSRRKIGSPEEPERHVRSLVQQVDFFGEALKGLTFNCLAVGGGTPSLLTPSQIERLFGAVNRTMSLGGGWVTFEATPASVDEEKLRAFREQGFNRISIGVQSLNPEVLMRANRCDQTPGQVSRAIRLAKAAGFSFGVNADLILGLAGDTPEGFLNTLRTIVDAEPEHIVVQGLRPVPIYTRKNFGGDARASLRRADEQFEVLEERVARIIEDAGYHAWSVPSRIWHFDRRPKPPMGRSRGIYDGTYSVIGFGAGAWSHIAGVIRATQSEGASGRFDPAAPVFAGRPLTLGYERLKYLLSCVRNDGGILDSDFRELFGLGVAESFGDGFLGLERDGLAVREGDVIRLKAESSRSLFLSCLRLAGKEEVERLVVHLHRQSFRVLRDFLRIV